MLFSSSRHPSTCTIVFPSQISPVTRILIVVVFQPQSATNPLSRRGTKDGLTLLIIQIPRILLRLPLGLLPVPRILPLGLRKPIDLGAREAHNHFLGEVVASWFTYITK